VNVLENGRQRKTGLKGWGRGVRGNWRRLHDEELHDVYSSWNIIR
jgi:hypothetical protein